jgi:hypothetical protein
MATKLTELELFEISCVDEPANEGARVLMFKRGDPLAEAIAKAEAHVSRGEVAEAVALAKSRTPAPANFWRGALASLVKSHIAPGIPPAMAGNLALATPDGKALLAALARATT